MCYKCGLFKKEHGEVLSGDVYLKERSPFFIKRYKHILFCFRLN